jgi:hypothetical protein
MDRGKRVAPQPTIQPLQGQENYQHHGEITQEQHEGKRIVE